MDGKRSRRSLIAPLIPARARVYQDQRAYLCTALYLAMFPAARLCRHGVSERQRAAHFGHAYIPQITYTHASRRGRHPRSIAGSRVAAQAKQFHLIIRHPSSGSRNEREPLQSINPLNSRNPLPDLGSRVPLTRLPAPPSNPSTALPRLLLSLARGHMATGSSQGSAGF